MTHKNPSGYSVQTAIALVLFILGLMLLVVWAILYANRLSNNLQPEWWIWFFLGFGLALLIIGLIWLIIVQYIVGSKTHEMYEKLCQMEKEPSSREFSLREPPSNSLPPRELPSKRFSAEIENRIENINSRGTYR